MVNPEENEGPQGPKDQSGQRKGGQSGQRDLQEGGQGGQGQSGQRKAGQDGQDRSANPER